MTREEINIKYDVNLNFVDYLSLIHSIPKKWHDYIKTFYNICNVPSLILYSVPVDKLLLNTIGSRYVYDILIKKICKQPDSIIKKWEKD